MSSVDSSALLGDPLAIAETMPGVGARFVELGDGLMLGLYHGTNREPHRITMFNDLEYLFLSCVLAGRIESGQAAQQIALGVGSGIMGFAPNTTFQLDIPGAFRQLEVLVTPERLATLMGEDFAELHEALARGCFYHTIPPGQETLASALCLKERIEQAHTRLSLQAATLEFLACRLTGPMLPDALDGAISPRERRQLLAARERLLDDLSTPPTIAELARHAGLNQLKLKRGFKQLFGEGVYAHFLRARMDRARLLLRRHNVRETAYLLGYSNVSHFGAAFRRRFGVTPGEARRAAG